MSVRWIWLVAATLAFLLVTMFSPFVGGGPLDLGKAFDSSIPLEENVDWAIFEIRLARSLFASIAGAALGICGAVFQTALRNDLATPYTLGISGGATLGALLAIQAGALGFALTIGGLIGGGAATAFVLFAAHVFRGHSETASLLLAGITLNFLFSAIIIAIQYFADPTQAFQMIRWAMGGVDVLDLRISAWLGPVLALAALSLIAQAQSLNLLALDDESSRSLGENPDHRRIIMLVTAAAMTALVVSFAGPIGFIGLIVPHLVRRFTGMDNRFVLPASLFAGGALLNAADTAGRLIGGPQSIPVGIMTTMIGGPLFLYIVFRKASG